MGKANKHKFGLAKAKKAGSIARSDSGGGSGKVLHRGLQLGGTALLLQGSKHVEEIPFIKCKPDTLATIAGVVGVIALRKKNRKFAEDLAMAGANALLGRWTYTDKIELFVSGSDVKLSSNGKKKEEQQADNGVKGSVKVRQGKGGRPEVEVTVSRDARRDARETLESDEPDEAEVIETRNVA